MLHFVGACNEIKLKTQLWYFLFFSAKFIINFILAQFCLNAKLLQSRIWIILDSSEFNLQLNKDFTDLVHRVSEFWFSNYLLYYLKSVFRKRNILWHSKHTRTQTISIFRIEKPFLTDYWCTKSITYHFFQIYFTIIDIKGWNSTPHGQEFLTFDIHIAH